MYTDRRKVRKSKKNVGRSFDGTIAQQMLTLNIFAISAKGSNCGKKIMCERNPFYV
jgi:hypothetical protein